MPRNSNGPIANESDSSEKDKSRIETPSEPGARPDHRAGRDSTTTDTSKGTLPREDSSEVSKPVKRSNKRDRDRSSTNSETEQRETRRTKGKKKLRVQEYLNYPDSSEELPSASSSEESLMDTRLQVVSLTDETRLVVKIKGETPT